MNIIFLDIDGVLITVHKDEDIDLENRIKILAKICKEYNCKIVIESSLKKCIDEDTLQTDSDWIKKLMDLFNEYGIECIGRTPSVTKKISENVKIHVWKEDEIRLYLFRHPEIDHYCIIDDDLGDKKSDLNKVRDHLVKTLYCSDNHEEEGMLFKHKEQIEEVLKKENKIKKLSLKRKKR